MRRVSGEVLTIASLNTRGIPLTGSQLAERYAVIGAGFDAGPADVVCCQEVFTYWHLRLLVRRMRSFRQVSYWRAPAGPAGGLVTSTRILRSAGLRTCGRVTWRCWIPHPGRGGVCPAPRPLQDDATPAWTGRELLALATDGALLSFAP